jgi:uncharacterized protein
VHWAKWRSLAPKGVFGVPKLVLPVTTSSLSGGDCSHESRYRQRFPVTLRLRERLYNTREILVRTILLLTISNIFMTFAWYGHLKYRSEALWKVILASWGIAFFEYCFQVPANRIGSYEFTTAQLKTIQEVITLSVFSVFSILYLGEKLKWNYAAGFGCISLAVFFVFHKW